MRRRGKRRATRKSARTTLSRRQCGTMQAHFRLLEVDPGFRARQAALEHATIARMARATIPWKVVTIPTVVHVVHNSPAENISDAQVRSQIRVLNRDFRKLNPDRSKVPAVWAGLVADVGIKFKLSKITRTQTNRDGLRSRRLGQVERDGRGGPVADQQIPERVGLHPRRRAARLRPVPGRAGEHGRSGDPQPRVRHRGDGDRAVSSRDARRPTRSGTGSTSGTSGGTPRIAAAPTSSLTRPTRRGRTSVSRRSLPSPAATARMAICS